MTPPNGRSQRQGFLGPSSERILGAARIGVVGLGGGGSQITQQLAHVGIGELLLIDPDVIEPSNLNRLVGATEDDARREAAKVVVAKRLVSGVNPTIAVDARQARWQEHSPALAACDIVVGCVDSFAARDELEKAARRYHVVYVDIGMDVHGREAPFSVTGQVAVSIPGCACLWCMSVLRPELVEQEAQLYGSAGARPQVVWPNGVLASTAVGLIVQLLCPWHPEQTPLLLEYDGNTHEVRRSTASEHLWRKKCAHFRSIDDLGDPWFSLGSSDAP